MIVASAHSFFPVYELSRDNIVGIVVVKAIYANLATGVTPKISDLMTPEAKPRPGQPPGLASSTACRPMTSRDVANNGSASVTQSIAASTKCPP